MCFEMTEEALKWCIETGDTKGFENGIKGVSGFDSGHL